MWITTGGKGRGEIRDKAVEVTWVVAYVPTTDIYIYTTWKWKVPK